MIIQYNNVPIKFSQLHRLIFILIIACVIGGCTGSTSGGIKVYRVQVVFAMVKHHFLKIIYPHIATNVRCDDQEVSQQTVSSIVILISLYMFAMIVITLIMCASNFGIAESIASAVSFLSNAGVIATEYGASKSIIVDFPQTLRAICAFAMLLGRLEFIAIIVILVKFFRKG